MTGISWARCSMIYSDLSDDQRKCLGSLRNNDFSKCTAEILDHFSKIGVIHSIGGVNELTPAGRVIAAFCRETS
jgi:hypothetical protein